MCKCVSRFLTLTLVNSRNDSKHFLAREKNTQFLKYLSAKNFVFNSGHYSSDSLLGFEYSFIAY
jgi:hypothetical protein